MTFSPRDGVRVYGCTGVMGAGGRAITYQLSALAHSRLTRCKSVAPRIAIVVDAVVGRRPIDTVTPGEAAWATALPDLPFGGALALLGLGDAITVAGQILGQKEAVNRRLLPGAADTV